MSMKSAGHGHHRFLLHLNKEKLPASENFKNKKNTEKYKLTLTFQHFASGKEAERFHTNSL